MAEIGILASVAAGLLSFLSPCVLPLIPVYVSIITGVSIDELRSGKASTGQILLSSSLFVIGFSTVFIALGASASAAGSFLVRYKGAMNMALGAFIAVMGLFIAGFVPVPQLYRERKLHLDAGFLRRIGPLASALIGMGFAFGWTPCVGPILSSILALAASGQSVWRGVTLLSFYSLGLGVPFILTGLFFGKMVYALDWFKKNQKTASMATGVLLVGLGVILVLQGAGLLPPLI